ncbi:MAG: hypothetical protein WA139_01435 [Candidatus Aenigmatarchaeota archaeon]
MVEVKYECQGFVISDKTEIVGDEGKKIKVFPFYERSCYCDHCPTGNKQETHNMTFNKYQNNGSFIKKCPNIAISRGRKAFYKSKEIPT